jgi:hypothetical protein
MTVIFNLLEKVNFNFLKPSHHFETGLAKPGYKYFDQLARPRENCWL